MTRSSLPSARAAVLSSRSSSEMSPRNWLAPHDLYLLDATIALSTTSIVPRPNATRAGQPQAQSGCLPRRAARLVSTVLEKRLVMAPQCDGHRVRVPPASHRGPKSAGSGSHLGAVGAGVATPEPRST